MAQALPARLPGTKAGLEILTGHEAKGLIEPAGRVALDVILAEGVDQHVARRRAPAQGRGDQRTSDASATTR
jgi:hypothetical protein